MSFLLTDVQAEVIVVKRHGGVPEWTIGTVSKTVEPSGSGGSNPSPSAKNFRTPGAKGVWGKNFPAPSG